MHVCTIDVLASNASVRKQGRKDLLGIMPAALYTRESLGRAGKEDMEETGPALASAFLEPQKDTHWDSLWSEPCVPCHSMPCGRVPLATGDYIGREPLQR